MLEGVDESAMRSSTFTTDDLPQDTDKRKEFVNLVNRNGIKLGGPSKRATEIDPFNRRHVGASNPTDAILKLFPTPEFSSFKIQASTGTARMGESTVTFVKTNGRWFLSEFFEIGIEAE
ncbi:MAG: hypothetical protein ACSHXK_04750 [Oceanococcus sp.]